MRYPDEVKRNRDHSSSYDRRELGMRYPDEVKRNRETY